LLKLQDKIITTTTFKNKNNTSRNKIRKAYYFGGLSALFLGLSVLGHPSGLTLIPGFIGYSIFLMIRNRKMMLISFLTVLCIALFFVGLLNYLRFGSFTDFGYYSVVTLHHGWKRLVGLLISPGKEIILYFPIVILLPLALKYTYSEINLFLSLNVMFATWWLVRHLFLQRVRYQNLKHGSVEMGCGGASYLEPTLPFITLVLGVLLVRLKELTSREKLLLKFSFVILSASGFHINLLGVLIWYVYGMDYRSIVDGLRKNKLTTAFDVMTWNPYYSFIVLQMKASLSNYVSHIKPVKFQSSSYGLAPCSYDIFLYCKFGITPIVSFSAIIAIIAIVVQQEISKSNLRKQIHIK